jgi:superfamily II DNA/RNA helicase
MPPDAPSRDQLAERFIAQLPYPPYPMQEEALLAWFTSDRGVMVCAPTGMGKTLIAQAALFEALHAGTTAYYTTPLIALTEQKFQEMQACAERWGFSPEDVGLVTGNRRVNPQARILVVVAEILLNRLLHPAAFDFANVSAVVMDEFHSFADPERGIVWELTLSMLPPHVRLMLLSATVGNAQEFLAWLDRAHSRKLDLIESKDRKVPLRHVWVPDQLLGEHIVEMTKGDAATRKTPALLFCFNRDECWAVAEMLKGLPLLDEEQKKRVNAEVDTIGWAHGVGPKLKQMLRRGVGIHHAGLLPKYRRVIGELFEQKLLAVVVCTETLAAGINLPARSVVLSTLVKGPFGKQKLVDASTAHQIFGRAGRPQYDTQGFVYALAHEDDVRILRWKEKFDQIPENTGDPALLKAKKDLKRKKPTRRENQAYWSEGDFKRLQAAPPGKLYSKGPLPWRLLAYLLEVSPEVARIQKVVHKRLLDEGRIRAGERVLRDMLLALEAGGFVTLDPQPPAPPPAEPSDSVTPPPRAVNPDLGDWYPVHAHPTPALAKLLVFRSVHPLYGAYLIDLLGMADRNERIQALESVLEMPRPLLRRVRVPLPEELPPGPLVTTRLDPELIQRGLIAAPIEGEGGEDEEEFDDDRPPWERPPTLADKLRLYFDALYPQVTDVITQSVWAAGELFAFAGDFNKYVQARELVKQEGIVFRHLLRLILLCGEFRQVCPPGTTKEEWEAELKDIADRLAESCRAVDPASTDQMVEQAAHVGETAEGEPAPP